MSGTLFNHKPADYSANFSSLVTQLSGAITDISNLSSQVSGSSVNVNGLVTNLLGSTSNVLGVPNVNVGNKVQGRKCTTSAVETTLFTVNTMGFAFVQAHCAADATGNAIVRVYNGSIASANLIACAEIAPGTSQVVACMPAFSNDGFKVTAQSDGTHNVCVYFSYYSPEAYSTTDFVVSEDAYGHKWNPNTNYGSATSMYVGWNTSNNVYFSTCKFDLSSLSAGSMVAAASLVLTAASNRATQHDFYIAQCLRDWVQSEMTWNSYSTGNAWGTAGGGSGVDYSATPVWYGHLTGITTGLQVAFDVTNLVRDWVENGVPNYGFFITEQTLEAGCYTTWCAYENATPGNRPKLQVSVI